MNQEEINSKFADFLGWKKLEDGRFYFSFYEPEPTVKCPPEQLRFHQYWNWLMPVVEKIENLDIVALGCCRAYGDKFIYNNEGFSVKIEGNSCEIWIHFTFDPESSVTIVQGNSKLEAVYEACLDFVDWFQINFANVIP